MTTQNAEPRDCTRELNSFVARLPEKDQEAGVRFSGILVMLSEYKLRFDDALELLDEAETAQRAQVRQTAPAGNAYLVKWDRRRELAAREAVMSIYHYGNTLRALLEAQRTCASLRYGELQPLVIRKIWRHFLKEFPGYEDMRNAVAHQADRMFDADICDKHSKDCELYFGKLVGRDYRVTNNRKHHLLAITPLTARKLELLNRTIYAAFPNIFAWYAPFT